MTATTPKSKGESKMPLSPADTERLIKALNLHSAALLTVAAEVVSRGTPAGANPTPVTKSAVSQLCREMLHVVDELMSGSSEK